MSSSRRPQHGNLPHGLTRLVGRSEDIARLNRDAGKSRLLILVGPAGVGKTRLAIEFAASRADRHEGGAWFVDLSGLNSPALVADSVAEVLGVVTGPHRTTVKALVASIGVRDLLIVLDNCEHLLEAAEQIAHDLLAGCPRLHLVATSREALQVAGGLRWPVQPLAVPEPGAAPPRAIARSPAVELFAAAAALALPGFAVDLSNAETVAEICRRLDGLPLALELCASRVRMMPPGEILDRLSSRFDLLTDGSRVAAPRQRTLRATVDWSYELLDDSERAMFRRLGVFSGGFDLQAVHEVVAGGPVPAAVLPVLSRLVDKSLVQPVAAVNDRARYRLLETVREYALERLADNAEGEPVRRRHAHHYLEIAEQAAGHQRQPDIVDWLDRVAVDNGNLRAALDWALSADSDLFLRLTLALCSFWTLRARHDDAAIRLSQAFELEVGRTAVRSRLLDRLGILAWRRGDYPAARRNLEESVAIAREIGDEALLAGALGELGFVLFGGKDFSAAGGLFKEQLEIASGLGEDELVADALHNSAIHALHELDGSRAVMAAESSLSISRRLGDVASVGLLLGLKGVALILSNDLSGAGVALEDGIRARVQISDRVAVGSILAYSAELAARLGRFERALRLAGMAETLYAAAESAAPSLAVQSRQRWIGPVQARLGARAEALLKEGAAYGYEEAIEYALDPEAIAKPRGVPPRLEGVSRRELEVAELVASGLTNREVAGRLGVAVRTVDSHLEHVRTKLGVSSRAEIAQWVSRHRGARGVSAQALSDS